MNRSARLIRNLIRVVFRARHWFRLTEIQVAVLFGSFGLIFALFVPTPKHLLFSIPCFLVVIAAVVSSLRYVSHVEIKTDSLILRRPLGRQVAFTKSDLHKIQMQIAKSASRVCVGANDGRKFTIAPLLLNHPERLIRDLHPWIRPCVRYGNYQAFSKASNISLVLVLSITASVFTIRNSPPEQFIFSILVDLVLVGFTICVLAYRVTIDPAGMTFALFGRETRVGWNEVKLVTLYSFSGKTQFESASLEANGKTWRLGFYDDYLTLRDTILANVPASLIEDHRSFF